MGLFVYSNSFHCSFHFDDFIYIVDNVFIRNIHDIADIWRFYPCRFVPFFSFALDYHFNGLNVVAYHVFNLAVHLTTAILVSWFTLLILSTPGMKDNRIIRHSDLISLLAGLVFVSHPVQTEAVTYICQRMTSLSALFYLASLCLYVRSRLLNTHPQVPLGSVYKGLDPLLVRIYYIGSLILAIVAMFTKENAVTLPLMIFLIEFCFLKDGHRTNWRRLIPFLFTLLIIPLTMVLTRSDKFQEIGAVINGPKGISPMHYLVTQFRVMTTYLRLDILPVHQNIDYEYPVYKNILELPVISSLFLLTAILFTAQRLFFKYRLLSFSMYWFFLTLIPESSFLPFQDVIFEHRLYLPLAGYSIFLVSGIFYLFGKNSVKTAVIILTMMVSINSLLAYQRNRIWTNELSLWNDAVSKSPDKSRPYHYRGFAYDMQGKFTQAIADFNKAIVLDPMDANAFLDRGFYYFNRGNLSQATADFKTAIKLDPNLQKARNYLGVHQ